ncbi:Os03g0796700, partial [Oryza sativa Japonica Group]
HYTKALRNPARNPTPQKTRAPRLTQPPTKQEPRSGNRILTRALARPARGLPRRPRRAKPAPPRRSRRPTAPSPRLSQAPPRLHHHHHLLLLLPDLRPHEQARHPRRPQCGEGEHQWPTSAAAASTANPRAKDPANEQQPATRAGIRGLGFWENGCGVCFHGKELEIGDDDDEVSGWEEANLGGRRSSDARVASLPYLSGHLFFFSFISRDLD